MTTITATEFKLNLGKYLRIAETKEIAISRNGKPIVQLVPYRSRISDSLVGVFQDASLPKDFDGDYRTMIREMRMQDYANLD